MRPRAVRRDDEPDTEDASIPEVVDAAPPARAVRVKVGTTGNRKIGMLGAGVVGILLTACLEKVGVSAGTIEYAIGAIGMVVSAALGSNGLEHLAAALGKRRAE